MQTIEISVKFPKDILAATRGRKEELEDYIRRALAVYLYRQGSISMGKAVELAGMKTKWDFTHMLAEQNIPIDYTAEEAKQDLNLVEELLKEC